MIDQLEQNLDNFTSQELWKPMHNVALVDFLDDKQNVKLYVWIDMKEKSLMLSTSGVPSIEENIEQFQMVYFCKIISPQKPITIANIAKAIHIGI